MQVRVRKKQVQEFELERNSLQKFQKLELKKRQKNSKVTVRQKKGEKSLKFAKLDLGLQKKKVSKIRVRENVKNTLQSHH